MRDFSKKLTKPNDMDMKKTSKPRMEDYDRRERRERDKLARQQVQTNDRQQGLFREPIRVDPSEGDQIITSKLGDFSMAKTLIEQKGFIGITSGRRPPPMQPPPPQPMPPQSSSSNNNRLPLPPPSHNYQQQQQQQTHPPQSRLPYMKQADNKPPYSGRGGYPGQPVKNDIRSSSGMAPPRGPPPQSSSSSSSSNLLPPPATSIMPNGRQGGSSSSKMGHHSSSSLHNGHFSQPSIPNMHKIPDINSILSEMMTSVTPHTEISATPRIQIDNYDLNGPNRHKYSLAPPIPKPPKESPVKPSKEKMLVPNSTILDHDLELSESDDERKKQTSVDQTSANSSESSESNSSESGSEESNGTKVEPAPPPAPPSNQWSLGRFFNKQAATQAQNDASPHSGLGVVGVGGVGVMPTTHQIPEPNIKNEPSMPVDDDHLGSASISPLREPPILAHIAQQPLSPIMNHLPAIGEIKKESDSLFSMPGKPHSSATAAAVAALDEFVTIQPGQIKNESFEKSPSSSPIPDEKQLYTVESDQSSAIFEAAAEYEGIKPLSGLSDSSSCETVPEAEKPMVPPVLAPPSPLPPVIPAPVVVPVVPKPSPKLKSSSPPTAGRKRRKRLPKDKKQSGMDCSSDEEDGEYSNTVSPAKSASDGPEKKGRGRPRKNTPSGNISSASSTKGPTLTAKKEVGQGAIKKTTARRRMSRQNSVQKLNIKSRETIDTSDPSSSDDEDKSGSNVGGNGGGVVGGVGGNKTSRGRVLPTKAAKKANVMPVVSAAASRPVAIPPPVMKHEVVVPVAPVSNRRIVKQINKRAPVEKSSSDDDDDDDDKSDGKSDDDDKDSSSTTSSSSDTSIDDRLSPTRVANENTTHSMGASGPGGSSSSHRHQYSPIKKPSSKSKVSLSSCSDDHSDSESEKSRRDKKIRDKTKSDKNKSDTLRKLFNLRDGGAKNKGQVLIVDQSEELQNQAKEQQLHHHQQQQLHQHQQQQQQQQQPQLHTATTPNATATPIAAAAAVTPTTTTSHHHEKLLSPIAFKSNISNSTENLIQQQSILNYNTNNNNNNNNNNGSNNSSSNINSHILNNSSSLLNNNNNSNHSTNSNTIPTSQLVDQQPRLKSPRIMTPTQAMTPTGVAGILAKTPDRSSVERKLSTRIATPTRTPTRTPNRTPTRTPTPTTQLANIPSPHLSPAPGVVYGPPVIPHHTLICKIDLSRLPRYNPDWKKNPYRLYGLSPPISSPVAGDAILAADLAASNRQKTTPRSGSSTPTALLGSATVTSTAAAATMTGILSGSKSTTNGGLFENENVNLTKPIDGSADRGGETPPKPSDYSEKHLHHPNNGYVVGRVPPMTATTTTGDIKHENIKYEQDEYNAKYNLKLAGVKQEQLIKNEFKPGNGSVVNSGNGADDALISASTNSAMEEKQRPISPSSLSNSSSKDDYISGASKPRRKRSSSSSSSPFKDKKRKKDKDLVAQKDMLEQLPPTNHDRLLEKPQAASVVPPYGLPPLQQQLLLQPAVTSPKTTTTVAPQPVLFPPLQNNTNAPPLQPPQQPATGGTVRVYRSYFERNDDVMGEGHCDATLLEEAVRRKHAADRETNSFDQVTLYLEAALYFLLSGAEMEQDKRTEKAAWTIYKDTLALIKFISTKIRSHQTAPNGQADKHNKVAILSLRCQSLISLKLYKMRRIDCVEVLKISNEFFAKGSTEIVNGNTPSSISPTNSVCSQGSGSNTPPAQMVPLNVHIALQKQTQFFNYFISCHDLWDQADMLVKKGNHTDFFIALDHDYGPLTLHSAIYDVFKYVQAGLKKLKEMKVEPVKYN